MRPPWTLPALALTAMLAFSFTAGHPAPALGMLLGLGLACLSGPAFEIPRRILLLASAGVLTLALTLVGPPPEGHAFGLESTYSYRAGLGLGFLLIVLLVRKSPPEEQLYPMGVALLLTMVAGGTPNNFPFGWFVLAQGLLLTVYLRTRVPGGTSRRAALLMLGALLVAGAGAGGLAYSLRFSEIAFNQLLAASVSNMFSNSAAFASQTSLSAVRSMQGGRAVVVRVFSSAPATHWVGRRYLSYRDYGWHVDSPRTAASAEGSFFRLAEGSPEGAQVDRVELNPAGLETLFAPLDALAVDPGLSALDRDGTGVAYLPVGAPFSGSYQVRRGAAQLPAPGPEALLLEPNLPPIIARRAQEVVGSRTSAREQALALQGYLQESFEYGFGYPFSTERDPVGEFLEKKPAAHCELFAASMALMLRTRGIPSRYVTGFLVREGNALGGYSVARAKDAHAWVEAYLPQEGWTTFDPTPPSALPPDGLSNWEQRWDLIQRRWNQFKGLLASGQLARLGGLLVVLLLLALGRKSVFPRWQRRLRERAQPVDPALLAMRELLRAVEERVGPRPRTLSLREWARQVPAAREFLEYYELVRYRDDLPGPEQLARLQRLRDDLQG